MMVKISIALHEFASCFKKSELFKCEEVNITAEAGFAELYKTILGTSRAKIKYTNGGYNE